MRDFIIFIAVMIIVLLFLVGCATPMVHDTKTDDYPDYAIPVAKLVAKTKSKGILVCGSAEGICIAANKVKGARAVPVWTVTNAKLSRKHNDANILCLAGGKTVEKTHGLGLTLSQAKRIADTWLKTPFSEAERHIRRIKKIARYENA